MDTFMYSRYSCRTVQKLGQIGPLVRDLWLMETLFKELSLEQQRLKVGFVFSTRKFVRVARMS